MTHYYADIDTGTPEGFDDLGPGAAPSDLALQVADALLKFERQGRPRPFYSLRAEEDGRSRDLTQAEQEAFRTAVEQALDEVT